MMNLLTPPTFKDPEINRKAVNLYYIILGSVIIVTLTVLTLFFILPKNYLRWIFVICTFNGTGLVLLYMNKKGWFLQSSYLYVSFAFVIIFVFAWTAGGIKAPSIQYLPLIVLAAGILLGWRKAIYFGVGSGILSLGLVFTANAGLLPPSVLNPTNLSTWVNFILNIGILSLFQYVIVSSLDKSLLHANKELDLRKKSEYKFRNLIDGTNTGYAIFNTMGFVLDANQEYIHLAGYHTLDEIIGKSMLDWTLDVEKEKNRLAFESVLKNGSIRNFVISHVDKSGNRIPVEINATVMESDDTQEIFALCRNITERSTMEEVLRESEERFSKAYMTSPISFLIANLENGKIIEVNDAFIKSSGYTREEALSSSTILLNLWVDPNDRLKMLETLQTGQPVVCRETRLKSKNGDIVTALLSAQIIHLQNQRCIISSIDDISERKQAELELLEAKEKAELNETKYRTIFEGAPLGILRTTKSGKLLEANKACATIFGYTSAEEIMESIHDVNTQLYADPIKRYEIVNHVTNDKISKFENLYRRKNGSMFYANLYIQEILEDHDDKIFECIIEDITQSKEYEINLKIAKEKAEESDRLKTVFLQNMSHEIRTPMNAIIGFSDLLNQNTSSPAKLQKFTEIISHRCNDLLDIINDILDIAKIESGQLSVNLEECNLNGLFDELTSFFKEYQHRIGKEHIKFSMKTFSEPSDFLIRMDKVKLKQILINLLSNAFKFTDEGLIEGGCTFGENQQLLFYVTDTGMGIPPEKQELVFERFTQLHQGSKMNTGGTGLGLTIVKGLVGLLGGKISLKSEPGKGSSFSFTLPYLKTQPSHYESLIIQDPVQKNYSDKTILIVEDDIYNAEYLKEILSGTGAHTIFVENGEEAINWAVSKAIDLILMDVRLPGMDGYEATKKIKLIKPNLKIIAQTAYASQSERQRAYDAGCIDYISKPTKYNILLSLLNLYLS